MKSTNFELRQGLSLKEAEERVRRLWEELDIRSRIAEKRKDGPKIGFIEGPPTMNGEPHIGHIRGRMLKDLWYRLETMKGYNVMFRAGWDTQGLPVELQAEKELGLTGSKVENLKKLGEEKLVEACKRLIHKYNEKWVEADRLLGILFDYKKAYWTYKDEYIEREWRILEAGWKKGLLVEGYRVVAYCPSCQTSLSHSEVALGYEKVEDPSLYYKAKLVDEDAFLVIWTTMPFTVITDEMVGVHPEEEYAYCEADGETWIVALERIPELEKEFGLKLKPKKVVKGKELEGKRYVPPLLEEVDGQKRLYEEGRAHLVVAEEFVDVSTGTGLVHLSPANGEEDFEAASKRGLPVFNPIDDSVRFTEEAGIFKGMFVRDADELVAKKLEEKGLLVKLGRIVHDYPTCWRSGHKLVYLARREYFYAIDRIVDQAVKAAEEVEYYFESPKNRFLEIIKEGKPWCLSRERVWGTPLPIWVCKECGEKIPAFSRREIVEKALELPDGPDFELHRPWIDRVVLKCPKCGERAYREPFVLDTWHNSGAAPYASLTDEEYRTYVPVPFLTEGIDQTRGWAYTLLMEGVILSGRSPYRAFLFTGHVLDRKGEKMSKSKGNVIFALDLFKKYPLDLIRFYLVWKASPIDPLNFDVDEMMARPYQVINTLVNLHLFYKQNSEYDGFVWRPEERPEELRVQDRWLLSVLSGTVKRVMEAYEARRFNEMARALERFIIDVLSQKYIPLIRSELWDDSPKTLKRRHAIYWTLAKALETVDRLLHPISPYITDYLYNSCFASQPTSIVLQEVPKPEERDEELEGMLEAFWKIVSLANSARMKAKVKRRWPLSKAMVHSPRKLKGELVELLKEVINVKEVEFYPSRRDLPIELEVRPNTSFIGREFKAETPSVVRAIEEADPWEVERAFNESKFIKVGDYELPREAINVSYSAPDGLSVSADSGYVVVLDVRRDEELVAEGLLRDVARRLQHLRKERGYVPTEILPKARVAGLDERARKWLRERAERLKFLVRVREVELVEAPYEGVKWEKFEIDGREVYLSV